MSYEENLIQHLESAREAKRRRVASHPPQHETVSVPVMHQALTSTRPVSVAEFSAIEPVPNLTEYEERYRNAPAFDLAGFEEMLSDLSEANYYPQL